MDKWTPFYECVIRALPHFSRRWLNGFVRVFTDKHEITNPPCELRVWPLTCPLQSFAKHFWPPFISHYSCSWQALKPLTVCRLLAVPTVIWRYTRCLAHLSICCYLYRFLCCVVTPFALPKGQTDVSLHGLSTERSIKIDSLEIDLTGGPVGRIANLHQCLQLSVQSNLGATLHPSTDSRQSLVSTV